MSIWQTVTWDVARAGGFTAFGLLTLSVAAGLMLSLQIQSPSWPRIINSELHNFLIPSRSGCELRSTTV